MKKTIIALCAVAVLLSACGDRKTINGKTYDTYGFINATENHNPNIRYEVSIGDVFWSIVFCETIVIPVWLLGFDVMQPVGPMSSEPGVVG